MRFLLWKVTCWLKIKPECLIDNFERAHGIPRHGMILVVLRRTIAVAVALVLAGCSGGDPGGFGSPRPPSSQPPVSTTAPPTPEPSPERVIAVSTPGYRYEPATLRLPAGETVILELTNPDDQAHGLTVEALSLQMTANPGETVRLPVQAPESGSFVMYCSFPGHRQAGHRGRIEVG
jgi:plastocyanin